MRTVLVRMLFLLVALVGFVLWLWVFLDIFYTIYQLLMGMRGISVKIDFASLLKMGLL